MHQDLGSILPLHQTAQVWYCLCIPSIQKVEVGGLGVQGHPWLVREFEASLV